MNSCSLFSDIPVASLSHIIKAVLVIIMPIFVFVEIVVMIFLGPPLFLDLILLLLFFWVES